jgi:UDP-N-acetylmuramate dehydrogenase
MHLELMPTFECMTILENYPLSDLNTFRIDALARYFVRFNTSDQLCEILNEARFRDKSKLILGGGSNLLLTQAKLDSLVLKNDILGISKVHEDDEFVYIRSGAGENWHNFVMHCVALNYAGLENLSLIPGNVGAGPMQNIGAYGVELKDVFHQLEALRIADLKTEFFNRDQCRFGYRESIFKKEARDRYIVTAVTFRLNKVPKFNTSYGAINQELEAMGEKELTIAAISRAVCNIRRSKLPDPAVIGNAGSFFKNPEVHSEFFRTLQIRFPAIVGYPLDQDKTKLAAGWLIEQCGWKGKTFGDAGVHDKQALVLVNRGKATGNEIYQLSQRILESVFEKFGVVLEREVNII